MLAVSREHRHTEMISLHLMIYIGIDDVSHKGMALITYPLIPNSLNS